MAFYDRQIEMRILGSCIQERDCLYKALDKLTDYDFLHRDLKELFQLVKSIYEKNGSVNLDGLISKCESKKNIMECYTLASCYEIDELIEEVIELSNLRRMQDYIAITFKQMDCLKKEDFKTFQEKTKNDFLNIFFQSIESEFFDVSENCSNEILSKETSNLRTLALAGKPTFLGEKTGFIDLDGYIGGFCPGHLVIVGARPGCGKSTLMMNLVTNIEVPSLVFSLEMTANELHNKLILKEINLNNQERSKGISSLQDIKNIELQEKKMLNRKIRIDQTCGINPSQLYRRCHQYKLSHGLKIVYVDYLQLMGCDEKYENNQARVTTISRALKKIAKDLDITIVALAQLNREVDNREGGVPRNSDLRESGAIEADADIILLLSYMQQVSANSLDVHVTKNRFGRTGSLSLFWNLQTGKMNNLSR